jgi:regulator of protease activity HflC (stomatin/prohibitin superfamily)
LASSQPGRRMPLKRFVTLIALIIGVSMIYGLWVSWRTQWVPAGFVGVIYDAQGGLQKRTIAPSAVTVGWRQQLYVYPTQLQAAIYTQDPDEGEDRSADGILITTNDNANSTFDVVVMYRVKPEDVITVFNEFGPIPIEDIQVQHIRRAVKEAVNVVGPHYDVFELMGPKRQEASDMMTSTLQGLLRPKGITVERVMLGGCYPTADVQSKITARVNSLTDLEISRLKEQLAEIEKQTALVRAQAEAEARKVSAAQVQGKGIEMLRLDATEAALKKWDGRLPILQSKPGQTIIIGRDMLMDRQTGGQR